MNLPLVAKTESKLQRFGRAIVCNNLRIGRQRDYRLMGWLLVALMGCFIAYVARMHRIDHDAFHEMSLFREWLVAEQFRLSLHSESQDSSWDC